MNTDKTYCEQAEPLISEEIKVLRVHCVCVWRMLAYECVWLLRYSKWVSLVTVWIIKKVYFKHNTSLLTKRKCKRSTWETAVSVWIVKLVYSENFHKYKLSGMCGTGTVILFKSDCRATTAETQLSFSCCTIYQNHSHCYSFCVYKRDFMKVYEPLTDLS